MTLVSASSTSAAPRTRGLISWAMAALRKQVRGLFEVLAFLAAGAAAIWALLSNLLTSARVRRDAGPHLGERLAPFPIDD